MTFGDVGSWLAARTVGAARVLPGVVLRWRYPIQRLRERITIVTPVVGPHLIVGPGSPAQVAGLSLLVFNRLPFPIELDGLQGEFAVESRVLGTCTWVGHITIGASGIGTLTIRHDLTDSQAKLIRNYPERQRLFDCPILRFHGEARARTSFPIFRRRLQR